MSRNSLLEARRIRHFRIRRKVIGTAERPRMSVFRSARNMVVQLIDDYEGTTLVSETTLSGHFRKELSNGGNVKAAKFLGQLVAEKAIKKGIKQVVFDRGGYIYHGRIKALAEGSREKGLKF